MVVPSDPNSGHSPDVAGFLHRDASDDGPVAPDLDANSVQRRPDLQMETMQSSLVERIAAVDDERRRTAAQMHRALETHRGELSVLAKRQRIMLLVAVLIILLAVLSIGLIEFQVLRMQVSWTADLDRLQQGIKTTEANAVGAAETPFSAGESVATPAPSAPAEAVPAPSSDSANQVLEDQLISLRSQLDALVVDVSEIKSRSRADAATNSTRSAAGLDGPETSTRTLPLGPSTPKPGPSTDAEGSATDRVEATPAVALTSAPGIQAADAASPERSSDDGVRLPLDADVGQSAVVGRASAAPGLVVPEGGVPEPALAEAAASKPASRVSVGTGLAFDSTRETTGFTESGPSQTTAAESQTDAAPAEDAIDSRSVDEVVDALIEHRSGEIDRDHQRIARQLAAPAPRRTVQAEPAPAQDQELQETAADAGGAPIVSQPQALSIPERITVAERPFALQLIGFYSRELLGDFVDRSPLPTRVFTREETFRGRPWFVLIHSLHKDQAAARQASESLPDELGRLDIWIRELGPDTELEVIATSGEQG